MNTSVSLAGTQAQYASIQVRMYPEGAMHVQGAGPQVNRQYGVSTNLPVDETVAGYVNAMPKTEDSLAGSGAHYALAQVRIKDGKFHFQMRGPSQNRPYGAAFDLPLSDELESFIRKGYEAIVAVTPVVETQDQCINKSLTDVLDRLEKIAAELEDIKDTVEDALEGTDDEDYEDDTVPFSSLIGE